MTEPTYTLKFTTIHNGQKRIGYWGADDVVDRLEDAKDWIFKEQAQAAASVHRKVCAEQGLKVRVDVIRALTPGKKLGAFLERLA